MKFKIKIIIMLSLAALLILPISTQFVTAENSKINVQEGQDAITITTEYLTMKIMGGKPHFVWWNGNQSTSDEMYNVQYTSFQEYFGSDEILDSPNELIGGINYNLITADWVFEIIEEETETTVILTLSGLPNNAEIQFVIHIYNTDQTISEIEKVVEGLQEVKFDIIIRNWEFSNNAKGLTIKAQILESQKRHQVQIRNGTEFESGNYTQSLQFISEDLGNRKVAFYEWANKANVYDDEVKIDTIDVGTAYLAEKPGQGPGTEDPGLIQQWLTYPNYGDSLTMIHDPSVGINPEAFTQYVPLYALPVIGGLIATALIVSIFRKRN